MSKLSVTKFNNRTGSPFQRNKESPENIVVHQEVLEKTQFEKKKEKQSELIQKVSQKTPVYQANKPSSGVFTEVVTHGAFTVKSSKEKPPKPESPAASPSPPPSKTNGSASKSLLGFPSSANDLALDAKSDLESDPKISKEVKDKVIEKLFALVSMVQHVYESKVRVMTEFEKFKDTHMRNEIRREKEHSEQLYKLNMNYQNEVVQAIQRLKSEIDLSGNVSMNIEENTATRDSSIDFVTSDDHSDISDKNTTDDVMAAQVNTESDIDKDGDVNRE